MAPQYKLTYFNIRALAEFIRFLFAYGGIEYEDNRIDPAEWPKLKAAYPNQKLPVLETGGKTLNQSTAIGRFVAKKLGLAGSNDIESAEIDSAVENLNDVRLAFVEIAFKTPEDKKKEKMEEFEKETIPIYLSRLESQVKENGGYFVGGKLSWADIYLAAYSETFTQIFPGMFKQYPGLQGIINKVYSIPSIKEWISKRPKTDF